MAMTTERRKQIQFRLPKAAHDKLEVKARARGMSPGQLAALLIEETMDKVKRVIDEGGLMTHPSPRAILAIEWQRQKNETLEERATYILENAVIPAEPDPGGITREPVTAENDETYDKHAWQEVDQRALVEEYKRQRAARLMR